MSVAELVQSPSPGARVELFALDLRPTGGTDIHRFVAGTIDGAPVLWRGQPFQPWPIEASGFELRGGGSLPRPRLRAASGWRPELGLPGLLTAAVLAHDDLIGAVLTRWVVLERFLDEGVSPDPDAVLHEDEWLVRRKSQQTAMVIEWELASALDLEGMLLPRRVVLRDICTHVYRRWDAARSTFDYRSATCPYTGAATFDAEGAPAEASADRCGKRIRDCRARFGTAPLPTRAFPGVARNRAP
jgi:lambda family phage minor tail protein L